MKRSGLIIGVIALAIALSVPATAHDMRKDLGEAKYDLAVQNLVQAVGEQNTNEGLRVSAIFMLGELEAKSSVVPLMGVLRNNTNEKARIAAAWALCKIGNEIGSYAVKQAVRFDDSRKVQLHCAWYYNLYVSEGTFAFIPSVSSPTQIAELR